jgi:hypothetical protein
MESGASMKLDEQEKSFVTANVKALVAATPDVETNTRIAYVDLLQRIEADSYTPNVKTFLKLLCERVLHRTEMLLATPNLTEEAGVRASVVKDIYARIKEKVENEQSK